MKTFLSKYKWKLLVASVIFIIAIPLAINVLFKTAAPWDIFVAEWEASDALAFYGAILASVATIIGVYVSIEYAQKNYRLDEANRVKPYFALTHYRSHSKSNLLSNINTNQKDECTDGQSEDTYEEYRLKRVYIIIKKAGVEFKDKLSPAQQQRLKSGEFEWFDHGGGCYSLQPHPFISMPFEAENVGNGAATNTMIGFYKKGERRKGTRLYTIKTGDSFYFHVFCDDADIVDGSDYTIELYYGDITGNYYSQKYPVTFSRADHFCSTIDLSGKQEIEEKS